MQKIYDITVFGKVDATQKFVELNNILTNNLSKRLVELGEFTSSAIFSNGNDIEVVVNGLVQKHKAIVKNSLASVKCLAKYLNQYVDKANYFGCNNELYKAINYTRDSEALSATYCLRTKNYDFSRYDKDEFIVELKDKFSMSSELEEVITSLPDDFDGILTIRYQVENNYPLEKF